MKILLSDGSGLTARQVAGRLAESGHQVEALSPDGLCLCRFTRHVRNHLALKAGLTALGLTYLAAEGCQLPQLNAVRIPDGVDDLAGRKRLLNAKGGPNIGATCAAILTLFL